MTCQEAPGSFSALLDGDIGLTDSLPLEVHLGTCAECRQALEDLQNKMGSARPIGRRPGLRRSVIPRIPARFLPVAASVVLVAVLVVVTLQRRAELERVFRHLAPPVPSIRDSGPQPAPVDVASIEPATRMDTPSESRPAQTVSTTSTVARGTQPPPTVPRDVPADPSVTPRAVEPGQPEQQIQNSKTRGPEHTVRSDADASNPVPVAAVASAASDTRPPVDVVGRLVVRSRSGAERALAALLSRAGGTAVSRQRSPTVTVVKGLIPHSSYRNFAAGLRGIGSWQLESERSPLPDLLRVTVRLAE